MNNLVYASSVRKSLANHKIYHHRSDTYNMNIHFVHQHIQMRSLFIIHQLYISLVFVYTFIYLFLLLIVIFNLFVVHV